MKAIALACETIADEVRMAARKTNSSIPILWIESGMHNTPENLKQYLQSEIDRVENVDDILLLFGYCGNALLGLVSGSCRLIIPRVDDCVSLLLGGNAQRNRLNEQAMGYFLTQGWLNHENNLWSEYNYCLEKYGPERTRQIYSVRLHNYKKLNVIKTGAYDLEKFIQLTGRIARELDLDHAVVEGSLDLLCEAMRREWSEERFITVEPGREVTLYNLGILDMDDQPPIKMGNIGG